ncbi:MAG TPA: GNAT family protein [Candidatus Dormibacteraeota bacterium]
MTESCLAVEAMAGDDARSIAEWRYPEPYSFYNWSTFPGDVDELLDPAGWGSVFFVARDRVEGLVGFYEFRRANDEPDGGLLSIGLGMRPDLTGRGRGRGFVGAGLRFAAERFRPRRFVLRVATFNERAIRVYEGVGFRRSGVTPGPLEGVEFLVMHRTV